MAFVLAGEIHNAAEGERITASTTLHIHECCVCGITFAYPDELDDYAREHSSAAPGKTATITCPAGHTWHYTGRNEEQKLQERLERERRRAGRLAAERDQAEASARAHKGHATRLKNRAQAGMCPHGCNRHFKDLERHCKNKHPDAAA
jgi:hypothetical protein